MPFLILIEHCQSNESHQCLCFLLCDNNSSISVHLNSVHWNDNCCQVQFSMIEIYNEKVRDLLNTSKAPETGLQVREDAKRGVFYGNFMFCKHLHLCNSVWQRTDWTDQNNGGELPIKASEVRNKELSKSYTQLNWSAVSHCTKHSSAKVKSVHHVILCTIQKLSTQRCYLLHFFYSFPLFALKEVHQC